MYIKITFYNICIKVNEQSNFVNSKFYFVQFLNADVWCAECCFRCDTV